MAPPSAPPPGPMRPGPAGSRSADSTPFPQPALPREPDFSREPAFSRGPGLSPDATPGEAAAGVVAGVLSLWTPFTLILGLFATGAGDCTGSHAAICTRAGHLAAAFGSVVGAIAGLLIVVVGAWVYPRRDHGYWAVVGSAVAATAFVGTLGLLCGAPPN